MQKRLSIPNSLPLIPLKDTVVFPRSITSVYIQEKRSEKAILSALKSHNMVFLSTVEDPKSPKQTVYETGCVSLIRSKKTLSDGRTKILVQGLCRGFARAVKEEGAFLQADVKILKEEKNKDCEENLEKLKLQLKDLFHSKKFLSFDFLLILNGIKNPGEVCDLVLSHLNLKIPELQKALETSNINDRLQLTQKFLKEEFEMFQLKGQLKSILKKQTPKAPPPPFRIEQFQRGKKEDVHEYHVKIQDSHLPEHVYKEAVKQLGRLEKMHTESSDASIVRNYLDWILDLPWNKSGKDRLDLKTAQAILDQDHFELTRAKERILEFLAVRALTQKAGGPILCFAGPPGVGKTSLAKSIAKAIGRKCFRVSLGGVKDEAEIRGHRKTYVGAMPGKIIQALKTCETNNPVIILDEIDKLCSDFRGDPSSALLEVLDPEQNHAFKDHFLNLSFDLSKVLFIATANLTHNIPPALRDRFEIISISGYTQEEKIEIAQNYLTDKELSANGLPEKHIDFTRQGLQTLIHLYTREAGLRGLKREISSICRKAAKKFVLGEKSPLTIDRDQVFALLGAPRFLSEERPQKPSIGIATGLAWTEAGGELLHIEAVRLKSLKGGLILTGKLGETMKESAQAALSYVKKSCLESLGVDPEWFEKNEIHVHVPAGATPKEGPSAGAALATALISLITEIPIDNSLALTGEVTLSGRVLPVGGIKEKTLAAFNQGIQKVILPIQNEKDLESVPENIQGKMQIILVKSLDEVFKKALLLPSPSDTAAAAAPAPEKSAARPEDPRPAADAA